MNLNKLKYLYINSPLFIKRLYALIPFSVRNGKEYRKWRMHLHSNRSLSKDPKTTVLYAYEHFEFYKKFYNSVNLDHWEEIPLLDKNKIQESLEEFEKEDISKFYVTTGGITGKPAKFFQSNNVWSKEMAFVYAYFEKHGYNPNLVKASFRGGDFSNLDPNVYWKYNPNYNEIHFSPFHLNSKSVIDYVIKLNLIKPKFFHGYPSAFITLAKLMLKNNLKLNYYPTCFFLISEGYTRNDVDFLKEFFNSKVNSFYGHSERLIFAETDDTLQNYTPNLDYGYLELVDEEGKIITENNIVGELVGTSYDNKAMPLVRYRTGDFTNYSNFNTKTFGPIKGKWGQTCLLGKNGEEITLTALNLHSEEMNSILKVQFIQKSLGEVVINSMFCVEKNEEQIIKIENLLSTRVGNLISFKIYVTENFILNSRGKAPLIINGI